MEGPLQCINCERLFVGPAWFVSIESSDRGTLGWYIDRHGTRGTRCPNRRSRLIRYVGEHPLRG